MAPKRLSNDEINTRLQKLNDWTLNGNAIQRSLKFDTFSDAIDFINRISDHAEDADHHPEIFNVYNQVDLKLTTHDAQGLTHRDFELATLIDDEFE